MQYEFNAFTIRDGKITLYQRKQSNHAIWQCRFMAEGKCIRLSTREYNTHEATKVAGEIYDETRFKIKNGIPVGAKKFTVVWKEWRTIHDQDFSNHRIRYINTTEKYFLKYFSNTAITAINIPLLTAYWPWRRKNADRGEPGARTLNMEAQLLKQFLQWCVDTNYIKKVPKLKLPASSTEYAKRPSFTRDEMLRLSAAAIVWANKAPNEPTKIRRFVCADYAQFIFHSGLRPREARLLKWKHVVTRDDKIVIMVPKAKTRARPVHPQPQAQTVLKHVKMYSAYTGPEDFIFPSRSGGEVSDFTANFKALLQHANLEKNSDGEIRTLYSLRHTYCTFRILYGKVDVFRLATNMGTSAEMIRKHYYHELQQASGDDITQNPNDYYSGF